MDVYATAAGVVVILTPFGYGEHPWRYPELDVQAGAIVELAAGEGDQGTHWPALPWIRKRLVRPSAEGAVRFTIGYGHVAYTIYDLWGQPTSLDFGEVTISIDLPRFSAADFNADGFVNGDDDDAFARAFAAGEGRADFNGDGYVNGDDYDAFVALFEQGA